MAVYNSRRWRALRISHLKTHPLCQICEGRGLITPGQDVHHVVSFMTASDPGERRRLAFDPSNLLTVCDRCHNELHHGKRH